MALAQGTNLVTGYPYGPTNLPMYGKLLRAQNCGKLCRHKWLNETYGMYWCAAAPRAPHLPRESPSVSDRVGPCSGSGTSCRAPGSNMRTIATAGVDTRAVRWVPLLSARQSTYRLRHPGGQATSCRQARRKT